MRVDRDELLHIVIPPAVALALMLIYFAASGRWNDVHDPINSIVAMVIGAIGFAAGAAADRVRVGRARRARAGGDSGTPSP